MELTIEALRAIHHERTRELCEARDTLRWWEACDDDTRQPYATTFITALRARVFELERAIENVTRVWERRRPPPTNI